MALLTTSMTHDIRLQFPRWKHTELAIATATLGKIPLHAIGVPGIHSKALTLADRNEATRLLSHATFKIRERHTVNE